MQEKKHRIIDVLPDSIADELKIEPGDKLLRIDDQVIIDYIDYQALCSEENILMLIEKQDGTLWECEIEKEAEESLGIIFESDLMDRQRSCANKCIFCFIDQLPPAMRSTLYYKDDDWRLSFIMGNYITLTNLSEQEIDRIIQRKVSPLYISIHSTEDEIRKRMINNKNAGNITTTLKRFYEAGISFHCQIVLCPDINDKRHLDRTLEDLWILYPFAKSVAVVPVGLTFYREGLYPLRKFSKDESVHVVNQIHKWQEKCRREKGTSFVYPADEFYVAADMGHPSWESYEDFPQIENGVGLLAKFEKEFMETLDELPDRLKKKRHVTIVTGTSAFSFLRKLTQKLDKIENLQVDVIPIVNYFFGPSVTVAGLITGQDIIQQLKGKDLGDELLIPRSMLREGQELFLDDLSLADVREELQVPIQPVWVDGKDLVGYAIGAQEER